LSTHQRFGLRNGCFYFGFPLIGSRLWKYIIDLLR
jgi:hypothetical protein